MNVFKTTFLMALLTVLFVYIGGAIGGQNGMIWAFFIAVATNFFSYWFSDKIVLAMYGAKPVTEAEAPEIHSIVRALVQRAQIPMPRIFVIPTDAPNAFATGRNPQHAVVAVTEGILKILDRNELSGVLGHELSHVKHRDILIGSIAATFAGAISVLASMARWAMIFGGGRDDNRDRGNPLAALLLMILAPLAAMLIQMAISRSREYDADASGAKLCGHPLYLAGALAKLEQGVQAMPMDAKPATAHMFIVNPLTGGGILKLFRTHPPTEERIARLQAMARGVSF
ncbi:MAG: zinc metalloprotease HtpX [Pseudomonadota bacterium]